MEQTKIKIRNKYINLRNNFSKKYINSVSKSISNKLFNLKKYKNSKNIFIYLSLDKELNTSYIINRAKQDNKNIYCPVLTNKKREMVFRKYVNDNSLIKNKYGILEPLNEIEKIKDKFTIVTDPATVYNKNKYRIGYGGGYYDYFLKNNIYMSSIGLCFEQFICDFNQDIYDEKVDILITEKNVY